MLAINLRLQFTIEASRSAPRKFDFDRHFSDCKCNRELDAGFMWSHDVADEIIFRGQCDHHLGLDEFMRRRWRQIDTRDSWPQWFMWTNHVDRGQQKILIVGGDLLNQANYKYASNFHVVSWLDERMLIYSDRNKSRNTNSAKATDCDDDGHKPWQSLWRNLHWPLDRWRLSVEFIITMCLLNIFVEIV